MKLNFLARSQNKQSFSANKATDPVCLMKVAKDEKALTFSYKGQIYYFCSENCREQFKQDTEKYLL